MNLFVRIISIIILALLAGCTGQAPTATATTAIATQVLNAGVTEISNDYGVIKFGDTVINSTSELVIAVDVIIDNRGVPTGAILHLIEIRTMNLDEWATINAGGGGLVSFTANADMPLISPTLTLSDGSTMEVPPATLFAGVPSTFSAGLIPVNPFPNQTGDGFSIHQA